MELFQVTMSKDDAWTIMNELGQLDTLHFVDLNKDEQSFNLPYAQEIRRCDETFRKIL